ncbi:hypothetical protein Sango_3065900 [Sesamum angolense]|uniref:DUF4283 domain-containing protein n=1 Tax=Sesamum angolense TaxID=2727404 RepID=A0AAE1T9A3_9LAMI|nr:hypothetical protein Sango_3065900 [Sesamum angolense]
MEDVIEGGPCLYLGQPIVSQKWEPGMVLRKLKHTEVPVWIKLRHLPIELWTTEGLSTVASGIGRPLYPDAITRACTRLDFARVCIMLNVNSKLPKHVVIMMPNELGGESACKVDVEYEWLPPKCTGCFKSCHSHRLDENSLYSLTHTTPKTHTCSNISHAPVAMVDDEEEGDLKDGDHGAILAAPEMSTPVDSDPSMSKLKSEFNFKEFFELAMRVIEIGDSESLSALKDQHCQQCGATATVAPTSNAAPNSSVAPTACTALTATRIEAPQLMPREPQRPLAAVKSDFSLPQPLEFVTPPRPLDCTTTPAPLPPTSAIDGVLISWPSQEPLPAPSPPWEAPPCGETKVLSSLEMKAPTSNNPSPPVAGHILEQNDAVMSSPADNILPTENRLHSPTWNRTAPPLKHDAPTPIPVPPFTKQPPLFMAGPSPTIIPATTVPPAS